MDTNNGAIIGSWGIRGNGPGEFIYAMEWGINRKEKTITLHDYSNQSKIRQYSYCGTDLTLLKESSLPNQFYLREATTLENGNIIASVIFGCEKPLLLLSGQLDSLNNFGALPDNDHKTTDLRTYSCAIYSYRNTFVQAMNDLSYLACYEQKSNGNIKKKWEHYLEKPIYKNTGLDDNVLKRGFIDVKMTSHYIFCVYSGKKWDPRKVNGNTLPQNILVFDYNGKLIRNFQTDTSILKFAISEDEKTIFAVSYEPDIDIVKFDISDLI